MANYFRTLHIGIFIFHILGKSTLQAQTSSIVFSIEGQKFDINGLSTYEGESWQGNPVEGLLFIIV